MKSQTISTRVVSKSLQLFFAVVLLAFSANAQLFYVDWTTTGSALTHNFVMPNGTTGAVIKTNGPCLSGAGVMTPLLRPHDPPANYPSTFFTPTPPNPLEMLNDEANRDGTLPGCGPANTVVADYLITFSQPAANIRMHFYNLDNGTYQFFDSAMTPINVTRLSGNNEFETAANAVNSTPAAAINSGCETNAGANPNGACGTVIIPGTYTELRMATTDLNPATGGDSLSWTMSALVPTAANVSVSGRVLKPAGTGLMNARVVLTDSQGISQMAATNPFGHFRFDGVPAGETYVLSVFAKGWQFEPLAVSVVDDITDLEIIAMK